MIEFVTPGTQLRWHLTRARLERAWVVGAVEPAFLGDRDDLGNEVPTTRYRCTVPPAENGQSRLIRANEIVSDEDVLAGVAHRRPDLRAMFAALPAGMLDAAQSTLRGAA